MCVLCDTQLKSNQEAIAIHGSLWSKLTASLLSASSLCHTRLVRSLGNLHVVAGDRDPMCWEPCGSHRDTASAAANTGTLINLNMAQVHMQASSLKPTEPQSEALFLNDFSKKTVLSEKGKVIFKWFLPSISSHRMIRWLSTLPLSPLNAHNHLMYLGWDASTRLHVLNKIKSIYPYFLFSI